MNECIIQYAYEDMYNKIRIINLLAIIILCKSK